MDRQEILNRAVKTIYECVPELDGVELREDTSVNSDMGIDSMSFILVVCKLEEEFDIRIPNRQWSRISTLGQLADAIEEYKKEKL